MAIDWTKIYKKYKGFWVALKKDEKTVIASGKTAKEVWEKTLKKVIENQYSIKIGFSDDIPKHGYGILGQKGFFDNFLVKFDL